MKKKDVLMLVLYCIPWVFLTLYADWYQQTKYTISMITDLDG